VEPVWIAIISTGSAVVGILLGWRFGIAHKQRAESRRELERRNKALADNNNVDVTGEWYVAWQASVERMQCINTERLEMKQLGQDVMVRNLERAPENLKGGYLWSAEMQFFQGRYLMGWYFPLPTERTTSKGIMFFSYHAAQRLFYGKWVGASYDGDLCNGFAVISNDRERSKAELLKLLKIHNSQVNIIFTAME
jgi:hypothetical protein